MALNFPDSPTLNQVYTDSTSGFSYQWNGTVWISFSPSTSSQIKTLDDISASFDGVTQTFALTSNGSPIDPASPQSLIINLGGVIQDPTDDYSVSGSNLIFSTAPVNGLSFSGVSLGPAVPINVIPDGSVTPVKLSTGGPLWNTDGDVTITGTGTTALLVNGNARVTGILTVGTASLTLNGNTNEINGVSISSGIVTASSFVGSLTGTATGLSGTPNLNVGVITATSFFGDGSGLTGVVAPLTVSSFSPANGSTGASYVGNIVITYNSPVTPGIGTITLRTNSATGTIVESFDVQTSNRISINQAVVTIDPTAVFDALTNYYVVVPSGAFVSNQNVGLAITTYNFTSENASLGLLAWGSNNYGNLGQNNTTSYSSPIQIPGTTWSSMSGGYHSLATKTDGTLWSWGTNGQGQLGQNTTTNRSSPVQIPGTTWSFIHASLYSSLAIKTDGTLWSWGSNSNGRLGLNNTINYSSPVQIPGTNWKSISSGRSHSLATKTDGTLWAWGRGAGGGGGGALGQGESGVLAYRSSPVQIPGTTWSSISGGTYSSLATKTDGTLWSWGYNRFGRLGLNNTTQFSSPVQIPGTNWSFVVSGNFYASLATKTDGTLWSWGYNSTGDLGQNNTINYSSPVQIPGTNWKSISKSYRFSLATKTDDTLWAWGSGAYLGQNNVTSYSSPVQIPGTGWTSISANRQSSLATRFIVEP